MDYKKMIENIDKDKMPKHIGVIMDGNGRWAKAKKKSRIKGHYEGVNTVRKIVEVAGEIGLEYMTIYAFSTENWNRPKLEVKALFKLLMDSLLKEVDNLHKNNVNMHFIGTAEHLEKGFLQKVNKISKKTWNNTGLYFNIALNYGGRKEIIEGINRLIEDKISQKINEEITEEDFSKYLYTANQPDPDLIIRTSGEQRLSNFLVWQSAYSEFWFTKIYWPDFDKANFLEAILDYQKRKRRFGDVK
ncbi:MAG: isoprenyl transferase [Candidatus Cloacimonadota bacterium]|nr:isoprenyl transferase [Candidatus Cloacimonadota bacterium]